MKMKFAKKITDKLAENVVQAIFNCGAVTIKFGQWYAMRYDISKKHSEPICKYLMNTLENCPIHSIEYTKKIYYDSFGEKLNESFTFYSEKPIASGSVGQVYRGYYNSEEVIMKVLHPNVNKDYVISAFLLKIFSRFMFKNMNINEFLKNIYEQFDYNNEAKNLQMIYNYYKNDSLIVIPKLIKHSKNIIIMTYESGICYNEIENTLIKQKIALSVLAFQRQNSSIYGFIHGDLHTGNWKVRLDNDSFKLIIYDYGIVYTVDKDVIKNWVKAYQYQDFEMLIKLAVENSDNVYNQDILNKIIERCQEFLKGPPNMMQILKVMIPILKDYNINLKERFLSLIISFALTEKVLLNVKNNECSNVNDTYISNCMDIIAFCKAKNTCLALSNSLENDIKDLKLTTFFKSDSNIDVEKFYKSIGK